MYVYMAWLANGVALACSHHSPVHNACGPTNFTANEHISGAFEIVILKLSNIAVCMYMYIHLPCNDTVFLMSNTSLYRPAHCVKYVM